MPFVYILRCADASYYTGSTVDLERRMTQHQSGEGANYTADRLPVVLVWAAQLDRIDEAFALEKRIQGWSRAKKTALIEGRLDDLPGLSRSKGAGVDPR
ncbi:GIY-YIG nuclease family protein [Plantibacter sp. YIM 135249]|uniref:GIY-YIG nuclease family protein n=1 Tax=Plantibacter sp. YIM 135249 TaxID=3423918 RepID=UPI003D338E66